jgi:hypothetical protein
VPVQAETFVRLGQHRQAMRGLELKRLAEFDLHGR